MRRNDWIFVFIWSVFWLIALAAGQIILNTPLPGGY